MRTNSDHNSTGDVTAPGHEATRALKTAIHREPKGSTPPLLHCIANHSKPYYPVHFVHFDLTATLYITVLGCKS